MRQIPHSYHLQLYSSCEDHMYSVCGLAGAPVVYMCSLITFCCHSHNVFNPLPLLSQSTKNRQEVEHPDLSVQPCQSRIPALPTIPRPGAQVTVSIANLTTNLSCAPCHFWDSTLREWVLLFFGLCHDLG